MTAARHRPPADDTQARARDVLRLVLSCPGPMRTAMALGLYAGFAHIVPLPEVLETTSRLVDDVTAERIAVWYLEDIRAHRGDSVEAHEVVEQIVGILHLHARGRFTTDVDRQRAAGARVLSYC